MYTKNKRGYLNETGGGEVTKGGKNTRVGGSEFIRHHIVLWSVPVSREHYAPPHPLIFDTWAWEGFDWNGAICHIVGNVLMRGRHCVPIKHCQSYMIYNWIAEYDLMGHVTHWPAPVLCEFIAIFSSHARLARKSTWKTKNSQTRKEISIDLLWWLHTSPWYLQCSNIKCT